MHLCTCTVYSIGAIHILPRLRMQVRYLKCLHVAGAMWSRCAYFVARTFFYVCRQCIDMEIILLVRVSRAACRGFRRAMWMAPLADQVVQLYLCLIYFCLFKWDETGFIGVLLYFLRTIYLTKISVLQFIMNT